MEGPDIVTANEGNFQLQVLEYSDYLPVVVEFWAKWSPDSRQASQQLEELASTRVGQFRLARVEADRNPGLVQRYGVHTLPTLKTIQNGVVTSQLEGPRTGLQIKEYIQKIAPGPEQLLLEKAAIFLKERQFLSAEEVCLEVLEEAPDSAPARLILAKSLIWQGELLEALTILNHFPASREFPAAEKLAPLAEALLTAGDLGSSTGALEAVYRRALQLIAEDKIPAALDGLLEIIRQDRDFRGGRPRQIVLGLFELLGERHPLTEEYRGRLANALF